MLAGPKDRITYSKKSDMPYTNAFIQELYRYRIIAPIGVPHKTTENTELMGYFIPKNTKVSSMHGLTNCKKSMLALQNSFVSYKLLIYHKIRKNVGSVAQWLNAPFPWPAAW